MKSSNKILTFLIILLISCQGFSQSLSDITFGTDSTFDVITWNIEWFPKNGSATVDSVSKIIESLNVDLIGLQEIDDTTLCRQMINNIPNYDLFMDDDWFGGLAYVYNTNSIVVQSIYKIYDTSPYWNIFPRSPLVIELTYLGEELVVINNHFKCCGDGIIDMGNSSDEEYRRYEASSLLKQYVDANFINKKVIILGDLNDLITDTSPNNVFQVFLNDSNNYLFADYNIAQGSSDNWSFPGWPSHLDHILITNELFNDFLNIESEIQTIKIDDFMAGGVSSYDFYISDHRPVGMKLKINPFLSNFKESSKYNIMVYPNPITDIINIEGINHQFSTDVLDYTGKYLHSTTGSKIDLSSCPKGIYLLIISNDNKNQVIKVVKD